MSRVPRMLMVIGLVVAFAASALSGCSSAAPAAPTAAPAAKTAAAPATTAAAPAATTAAAPAAAPAATTAAAPVATAAPAAAAPTAAAPTKVYEYNITVITDNTGPGADVMKTVDPPRKVALAWWNATRGKELGIKINAKFFDGQYNSAQIASLWAGALAGDKPIFIVGFGGADSAALQERLPTDKVPWLSGSSPNGFNWAPNQWLFYAQPTMTHALAATLNWMAAQKSPVRVGQLHSDQAAGNKDQVAGLQAAVKQGIFGNKVEYTGVEWVQLMAPDVANEVKRLIDKKPDYIHSGLPAPTIVAMIRALQQYKVDNTVKVLYPIGSGVASYTRLVPITDLEGHIEHTGLASALDTNIEAYKVYNEYKAAAGVSEVWETNSSWGLINLLLPLRALERVAKTAGADKVTGEAIYNAMYGGTFTSQDMLGITGDLTYTKEAPFPTKGTSIRITTVKDGKHALATPNRIPVPEVAKW